MLVTYEITNGQSSANCTFNLIVNDIEPPSIYCPLTDSLEVYLDGTCTVAFPDLRDSISYYDCTVIDTNIMWPQAGTLFTTDTVVWMTMDVYDIYGNRTENNHWIWIRDTIAPTITCPANLEVQTAPGDCSGMVALPGPLAVSDACGALPWTTDANDGMWPIGDSTVTFNVVDAGGNSASCTFTVRVKAAPLPDLAYSNISFCPTPSLEYPVNAMPSGGTFQCLTCSSIIASDGAIQPLAMQVGPNIISYDAPVGSCYQTTSDTITVSILPFPNAGADRFVTVCTMDAAFQSSLTLAGGRRNLGDLDAHGTPQ